MKFNDTARGALLIFAKYPQEGRVKTRMMPRLSASQCVVLQHQLIAHTLAQVNALHSEFSRVETHIWHTAQCNTQFAQRFATGRALLSQQVPGDLGQRLDYACSHALQTNDWFIVIGSDCTQLDTAYLTRAIRVMSAGQDGVIGAAQDGGYVLLGMQKKTYQPAVFESIPWGERGVLEATMATLTQLHLDVVELDMLADIDRPDDLTLLPESIKRSVQVAAEPGAVGDLANSG